MHNFDIAIIGAGPSGCTCALALQNSGLKVALIDKDSFPRDKICGDAIPGPAFKVLHRINPEWEVKMREINEKETVSASKGFAPNGKTITFNWKSYAYNSKRLDFDHRLFQLVDQQTDTTIINHRLQNITQADQQLECHLDNNTSFKACLVIGCDGANSVVSRVLGKYNLKERPLSTAVRVYYKDVADVEEGVNEFHFFKEITPGYFWIFPVGNGWVNVGLGVLNDQRNSSSQNLRTTLENVIASFPSIAPRFKGASIQDKIKGFALPLGISDRKISGDRYMLCGDAASLISPLWGHGIDTGMWSGYYAANQAIACFQKNNFSADFMEEYDSVIQKNITRDFIKSAKLLKLITRFPTLLNLFWFLLRFDKVIKWTGKVLKF